MHLFPRINNAFEIAVVALGLATIINIVLFLWRLLFKKYFPSVVNVIWGVINIAYSIAIIFYLYTSLQPLIYDWESTIIQYEEVTYFFGFFLVLFNTLYLLHSKCAFFQRILLALSALLLGSTIYYFITTRPYEVIEGAAFALDKTLLMHTPLANFITCSLVSLYFILFIGYRRKWKL